MLNEQRIFHRLSLHVPVIIDDKEKAEMKNISVGGLCLVTRRSINTGSSVGIKFTIPGNEKFKSRGYIIWSHEKSENEYECGLEFENLTVNNYEIIRKYIQTREN